MYDASKDPNYVDKIHIGNIEFSKNILNEINVGSNNFKSAGLCRVEVYGKEGIIPHFHIIGENFQCCPCIYDSVYFNHGTKINKFNSKDLKILDSWLIEIKSGSLTNWDYICLLWHDCNNPLINVPKNPKQPDYTKMINMRG